MKTVLCYGDSLTWGFRPGDGERHDYDVRWTTVLQRQLGDEFLVIPEGLSGRFTVHDDPWREGLNGSKLLLPVLASHKPIDLLVLMLGTNDILHNPQYNAYDAARGAEVVVKKALHSECGPESGAPQILLLAPPLIGSLSASFKEECHGSPVRSEKFAYYYRKVADAHGVSFFDAGRACVPGSADGVHLDEEGNRLLGEALVPAVLKALAVP